MANEIFMILTNVSSNVTMVIYLFNLFIYFVFFLDFIVHLGHAYLSLNSVKSYYRSFDGTPTIIVEVFFL